MVVVNCRMEEVMIMEALMSRLEDWRRLLRVILEPAVVLRSHKTVVDVCSLLRALKVGCGRFVLLRLVGWGLVCCEDVAGCGR